MKGVIASAVIAAVIVAGSVAYTNHIDKVSRELGEINDRVMVFLYDGDYESAGDEIEKLVQYLDENRTVLAATGNHEDFPPLFKNLAQIYYEKKESASIFRWAINVWVPNERSNQ